MRIQIDGQWQATSYQEMGDAIRQIARALLASGVQPGDRIGIFSQNRPEWTLVDIAILAVRAISVPIYATNSRQQAAYIVDESEMALIFTGDQQNYDKIQSSLARSSTLKSVIAFDDDTEISGEASHHFSQFQAMSADKAGDAEIDARLAAPEKALLDLIHLRPQGDSLAYIESLRLQNLDILDIERLHRFAQRAGKPKLQRAANIIEAIAQREVEEYRPL